MAMVDQNEINSDFENNSDGYTPKKAGSNYQPTKAVKHSYLPLRKNGMVVAGINFPGLFGYDAGKDKRYFCYGLIIEFTATILIALFARTQGFTFMVVTVAIALSIIGLDYFFCWKHQENVIGKENKKSNEKMLMLNSSRLIDADIGYKDYVKTIEINAPKSKWDSWFKVLIYLFVGIRLIFLIDLGFHSKWLISLVRHTGPAAYIPFVVFLSFYAYLAIIHTNYTGFALGSFFNSADEKKDTEKFYNKKHVHSGPHIEPPVIPREINLTDIVNELILNFPDECKKILNSQKKITIQDFSQSLKEGLVTDDEIITQNQVKTPYSPHQLKTVDKSRNIYSIQSVGFFTDQSLSKMIGVQTNNLAKLVIAIYGVSIQLESLDTENRDIKDISGVK